MTKNSAAVVVPAIIACLVICALVLFTCKYCYNPQFLWRVRHSDVESSYGSSSDGGEKRPTGPVVLSHEVVSQALGLLHIVAFVFAFALLLNANPLGERIVIIGFLE